MKKKSRNNKNSDHSLAHVLYQKLGRDWYAFTEVDGECYVARADDDFIQTRLKTDPTAADALPAELRKKLVA